jgi:acyl-CoA thioesterase
MDYYENGASPVHSPRFPGGGRAPALDSLGINVGERGEGRATLSYVVSPQHLRTFGLLHGGIVVTLLDTAMGIAVSTRAAAGQDVVTAQINVNFIRPAWEGEILSAWAEVRHVGRRTAVAIGEIHTTGGALVATGSATFLFVSLENSPPPG